MDTREHFSNRNGPASETCYSTTNRESLLTIDDKINRNGPASETCYSTTNRESLLTIR